MTYAKPSKNDPVSTISDLKSTIREVAAENSQNALNQSLVAGNATTQDAIAAGKSLLSAAGNESTVQAIAKQNAAAQLQNNTNSQASLQAQAAALAPDNNRGYSPIKGGSSIPSMSDPGTANKVNMINEVFARQNAIADQARQAELNQRQSQIATAQQQQLNNQQNVSAQAIASTQAQAQKEVAAAQAAAAVQSAQYGALGSILGGGGSGGSRHQYW